MSVSQFGRGLGQITNVLSEALFPVPDELGLDERTKNALQRQATMRLGLGMMAAKDRGSELGSGLGIAYEHAQRGLGAGLGQVFATRRANREDERLAQHDRRLQNAELQAGQDGLQASIDRQKADLRYRDGVRYREGRDQVEDKRAQERLAVERATRPQGTWSQPFEAVDPITGKPGMFQNHTLSGEIRPAALGGQVLGPKPDRSNESGVSAENAIYRQVVGAFGGTFDPVTGSIVGLDKDQASRVQGIAARASRSYVDGSGKVTIAEAVDGAMKDRINEKPDAVLPTAAVSRLKEGTVTTFANGQKWTVRNGQPVQVK